MSLESSKKFEKMEKQIRKKEKKKIREARPSKSPSVYQDHHDVSVTSSVAGTAHGDDHGAAASKRARKRDWTRRVWDDAGYSRVAARPHLVARRALGGYFCEHIFLVLVM